METLRNSRGFTLVELMIVIVIVSILAGIAVPLYSRYNETAKVREALVTMGAIISSQKLEKQKTSSYYKAANKNAMKKFLKKGIDLRDSVYFTYETVPHADEYTVTATATAESHMTGIISYDSATKTWLCTGDILEEMLPDSSE